MGFRGVIGQQVCSSVQRLRQLAFVRKVVELQTRSGLLAPQAVVSSPSKGGNLTTSNPGFGGEKRKKGRVTTEP